MHILDGVTVIDFTQAYSGPFCTLQLADFGAEVIKVERRGAGDQSREWTPFTNGYSGYYAAMNRNKQSLSLDLGVSEGVEVARRLVAGADIVVENFRVGTLDKLGLGYEALRAVKPDIIFASISGFGQTGPLRERAAYDIVVQAMSGVMDMTGFPDAAPVRSGPSIGDSVTGLTMALGICLAWLHKLNTGKGQRLDVSMLDTMFSLLEGPILSQTVRGEAPARSGNFEAGEAEMSDVYVCADGHFSVGFAGEAGWSRFCGLIGLPELAADPRFCSHIRRCEHHGALAALAAPFFAARTRDELLKAFERAGLPGSPVSGISELMEHPQLQARGMLVPMEDPGAGPYLAVGNPVKPDAAPATCRRPAPLMGQDSETVLRAFGYTGESIASLRERGVI